MKILDVFIHFVTILPVFGEALFDVLMWKWKGMGSDKPISTWIVRPILLAAAVWGAWYLGDKELWKVALVTGTAFMAFFNPLMGIIVKKDPRHLGDNLWDNLIKRIPSGIMRIWIFVWIWIVAVCLYYW